MARKHSRDEILEAALDLAFRDGLSALSFGRVAKHVGTSDRMIVYYFATKDELLSAVLFAMGLQLQHTLAAALSEPVADHIELVQVAWPVLATDDSDRVFALFFEANGLAVAGRAPYSTIVPQLVAAWIDWAAAFLPAADRRVEAETAVALVDGLLLLRQLAGPDAAERAARRLGILPDE